MAYDDKNPLPDLEELILLDHEVSQAEHKTIVRSLRTFMGSLMSPIGAAPAVALRSLKRQREIAENLLGSLSSFNKELAVTDSELSILRKALKMFANLPKPSGQYKMKHYQTTAIALLKEIDDI